jgi:hypothetical protein
MQAFRRTHQYAAPVGDVETALAAIWQELLGLKTVGRYDGFFESGGHSLRLTKLSFMANEVFDVNLDIGRLYSLRTLQEFALYIESLMTKDNVNKTTIVLDL